MTAPQERPVADNGQTWTRPRDEYGRAYYAPNEVPPEAEQFAHWRGLRTHPRAVTTPLPDRHDRMCMGGWVASGEWWLHCGRCRSPVGEGGDA